LFAECSTNVKHMSNNAAYRVYDLNFKDIMFG